MTTRRQFLGLAAGTVAATSARAQLDPNIAVKRRIALDSAIAKVTRGAALREGKVKLEVPPLIDNGNAVSVTVSVDSPMTAANHVKAIHLLTEKNPQPYVLSAYLGPRSGQARLATRARIADSGRVIAIAELSDGSYWSRSVSVIVTLSACLEDGLI
jgi:sulfur-oxidizing protein SoxY